MIGKCVLVLCSVTLALARSATLGLNEAVAEETARSLVGGAFFSDLRYVYRTYHDCSSSDLSVCLKIKLLTSLDKASRSMKDVSVAQGIKIVRQEKVPINETPVKSEREIAESLPRSLDDRDSALNSMILKKVISFFNSHTLQIKFPGSEELQRSFQEARGKDKKNSGWIMIPVILAGSMVPLAYGALALLSGKALIVSKLALVLASIIGIKKLVSGSNSHHEGSHEVVVSGGHGSSGWGRSFNAQNQAYSAYAPKDENETQ